MWTTGSTQACCCAYFSLRVLRSYSYTRHALSSQDVLYRVLVACVHTAGGAPGMEKRIAIPTSYYIVHVEIPRLNAALCVSVFGGA